MIDYITRQIAWSLRTFGTGLRTHGITNHIRKELLEIEAEPLDLVEWVDVIILALDGAWRAGYSPAEIVSALESKQTVNFSRTFPMPAHENEMSEHARSEAL